MAAHLSGEPLPVAPQPAPRIAVDTFDGRVHIEWDPEAPVTPSGQLAFFVAFLKTSGLFDRLVASCPLRYSSPNAPKVRDVLGTLLLSVLSGHWRYAHIAALRADSVSPPLLGMDRILSEDAVRRALSAIGEEAGTAWLQDQLDWTLRPLLGEPWVLDADTTVKPLYGKQEGAAVGYNPAKPGRPSHSYHSFMMGGLRLVLDVQVEPGNEHLPVHAAPALRSLLDRIGPERYPALLRGDSAWGNEAAMREAARKVARGFARSAYRRPVSEEEVEVLMRVFDLGRENKLAYAEALRLVLKAVLVSPQFLFITPAKAVASDDAVVALDDFQLASRLSYFLWATMPDAELASLAESGKLHEPPVLRAQVKRMIADKRSRALFDGFGAQWLGLSGLKEKTFDAAKFPQMTSAMRAAMTDEARLFFESILRENRSVVAFVDSDYTFLNGPLAAIYGLEKSVSGPEMRRVKLADANRGGILGMPGVLAMTSFPNRTSAVKRGAWVLEQVLGEHVPPPPANVPALEKQDQKKVANMTLRQRTEVHRTNPVCAS